jgi:hypothetical protein
MYSAHAKPLKLELKKQIPENATHPTVHSSISLH